MPKPTIPDLTDSGLTTNSYLALWDAYAQAALHGCLAFHGADGSTHTSGVENITRIADQMMLARIARMVQAKEDAEKEVAKPKKK